MADSRSYQPVLSSTSLAFVLTLPKSRQRILTELLHRLALNPSQVGDYSVPDETGRDVQFIQIKDILIAFWADDAVKELRIVKIEEI